MRNGLWSIVVGGVVGALLWAGPVGAQPYPGGLQACLAGLNTCTTNLTQTKGQLSTCNSNYSTCTTDLTTCETALAACQAFPATGQTGCWDSSGNPISCTNTGQDGDIQAGATLSYTDNGNGTITDNNTGLVWEKLCDEDPPGTTCPVEHDVDTTYT
jgi:hypothetical protein